jgi:phospholipid/cholesterol/gamma-HCH transport system substrate-binding protein
MNERVMQFRLGMFVIVAGLVLTMLIVWFGESPTILRDQVYVKVRYPQAPGVIEGVPVRKSGIRIGEVISIAFDERPDQPDGVLVTLALEGRYKLRGGSAPRINRSLIGDVAIDMQPGRGSEYLPTSRSPVDAPVIEGEVAPDPAKALEAATKAFEEAGDTLKMIREAASGVARLSKSADQAEVFLSTWLKTGQDVSRAANSIERVIKDNEEQIRPALASIREVTRKLDSTLDAPTQDAFKSAVHRISLLSARLDSGVSEVSPLLKDLGAPVDRRPTTDFGQTVRRLNRIAMDVELLSRALRDNNGNLNAQGTIQKLILKSDLYDNFNRVAVAANQLISQLRSVLGTLRVFADRISQDPSVLSKGALRPN